MAEQRILICFTVCTTNHEFSNCQDSCSKTILILAGILQMNKRKTDLAKIMSIFIDIREETKCLLVCPIIALYYWRLSWVYAELYWRKRGKARCTDSSLRESEKQLVSSAGPEVWDQCVLSVHSGFTGE